MIIELISDILGLSLEYDEYGQRVQARWDYIQEQLEKDPDYVGYDYVEYWNGWINAHYLYRNYLVDTNGNFYGLKNGSWVKSNIGKQVGYQEKVFTENSRKRTFQQHRIVASTFIPKYEHLSETPFWKLEVNHKDGIKHNNGIRNLEWMTRKENLNHAVNLGLTKSGLDNINSVVFLGTIKMDGVYKDQIFTLVGSKAFILAGISRASVIEQTKGKYALVSGCTWEVISKEDIDKYPSGPPDGYMEYYRTNIILTDRNMKPTLVTVADGVYSGTQFVLMGSVDRDKYGFDQSCVSFSARTKSKSNGCWFQYININEIGKYPRHAPIKYIEYLKQNPHLTWVRVKTVIATVVDGPNAGYQFCLFGKTDIIYYGFKQSCVSRACRTKIKHRGCSWEYTTQAEGLKYPRGISEEIFNSLC